MTIIQYHPITLAGLGKEIKEKVYKKVLRGLKRKKHYLYCWDFEQSKYFQFILEKMHNSPLNFLLLYKKEISISKMNCSLIAGI